LNHKLYHDTGVHIQDSRVTKPISFAQITDLHMHPASEFWPDQYVSQIEWWDVEFNRPSCVLPILLDEIAQRGVDFVFFTGDNIDHYSPEAAEQIVDECAKRSIRAHFQFGNHDWEPEPVRYGGHPRSPELRAEMGRKLCGHWGMPNLYYSFEFNGIRFIALDTPYDKTPRGYEGFLFNEEVDWLIDQLRYDGPIVAFHHVPFVRANQRYQLKAMWGDFNLWVAETAQGIRARKALEQCPNLLATFTGHYHFTGQSPLGESCQYVTAGAGTMQWRYVRIDNQPHPKSLRQSVPLPPA